MNNYKITLHKSAQQQGPVKRWWLDFPLADSAATLAELTETGLLFQGWVLLDKPASVQIYVKQGATLSYFTLDKPRPDVVQVILKQDGADHPQRNCGFRFNLMINTADFELGILHDGVEYPLCSGHIAGPFKVLQGKEGWLFLDNDTNKSVEQFTGKLLLDSAALQGWQRFMQALVLQSTEHSCKHALLLAPAKEAVYAQYHPFTQADVTPVQQLLALVPDGLNLCYPQQALSRSALRTFRLTDTHWAPYGAMLASVELAVALGLDAEAVSALFANDQYREVLTTGDLGNKVFPPVKAQEQLLKSFSYRKSVVADNGLANFGRVIQLKHDTALQQGHLVIFGASSSYSMLDYLCRIFSHITLMHTAGNLDPIVLAKLKPDYLVCQTNARYIVRAPLVDYSLAEVIAAKAG
ncbi:hypothetical protein J2X32_002693 [Rheinheimera pacifica]|uniref:alginate O-acetyltransferase AlgX-related protein n=1 Tax=Rheinheimera pacifica TaxID=173990 RepID=UPI0028614909|nr:hypothetical protein [Rheinheimera pacifica]MDR6984051.1 hypothetical protein [Rheinheimera pacifica]